MRAKMAKSGQAIHPDICMSDAPELRVVMDAYGGQGEAFRENEHPGGGAGVEMQPPMNVNE